MAKFRTIDYGKMLYEAVRWYFTVNSGGEISILYKQCAAIVQPLQQAFDDYDAFRKRQSIIASCLWQMGMLKNVLNYLFDNAENRIFITQSSTTVVADVTFNYNYVNADTVFGESPPLYEPTFGDQGERSIVTIHIPNTVDINAITAVVEQIKLQGIPYQIVTI